MKKSLALKLERPDKSISNKKLNPSIKEASTTGKIKSSLRVDLSPYPKVVS